MSSSEHIYDIDELCEGTYNILQRTIILKKFAYFVEDLFQGHEKQRIIYAVVTAVVVIGTVVCCLAAVNVV